MAMGGAGAAILSLPSLSFADNPALQFWATIALALYGAIVSITGADEHKNTSLVKLSPVIFRGLLSAGFGGIIAWALAEMSGLEPYNKVLLGGFIGYSGDKGIKFALSYAKKGIKE